MAAPKGNRFGAHDKPWTRALERHAHQNADQLANLAKRVFEAALDGDMQATREIADRLDGKPMQSVEVTRIQRTKEEMTDTELERIASGGGTGAVESAPGSPLVN